LIQRSPDKEKANVQGNEEVSGDNNPPLLSYTGKILRLQVSYQRIPMGDRIKNKMGKEG